MYNKNRKEQVKNLWDTGLGATEISKFLNISISNVSTYLTQSLGSGRKGRFIYKRRIFTLNESFFENIDTEAKAYFLGLLAADGNLSSSQNSVRIGLHEKDKEILECFRENLNYTKPLKFVKKVKEPGWNRSDQYLLEISSTIFRKSLEKHGLTPNKSLTLVFPTTIPLEYQHDYIRGYFDGNGCIHIDKRDHGSIIIASSEMFSKSLIEVLQTFGIRSSTSKHYKANCFYTRSFGYDNVENFYNFMYKDSTIFLDRKKQIFENWINKRNKKL